jgi:hypothetical protein
VGFIRGKVLFSAAVFLGSSLQVTATELQPKNCFFGCVHNRESAVFNDLECDVTEVGIPCDVCASAENSSGNNAYACIYGTSKNGTASWNDGNNSFNNWVIKNFGNENQFRAFSYESCSTPCYPYCGIFGAAESQHCKNAFNHWTILDFGTNNWLSSGGGDSCVFGVGENHGCHHIFNNWTIGNFGQRNMIYSGVGLSSRSTNVSIFGAGENANSQKHHPIDAFNNWTIGNFGWQSRLISSTRCKDGSGAAACVFGVAYVAYGSPDRICKNWTAEFQGDALIASFVATDNSQNFLKISVGTLGGWRNGDSGSKYSGMRFYFNDLDKNDQEITPRVAIVGAKLDPGWTVDGSDVATATLGPFQGAGNGGEYEWLGTTTNYAKAVALGPNFSLNVGRTRRMEENWLTKAAKREVPRSKNGGWETDASIRNGGYTSDGSSSIGTGNVYVLGAIAAANGNSPGIQKGSILRVDSGWNVNCFGPICDLETIAIFNGSLCLESTDNCSSLSDLLPFIADNMTHMIVSNDGNFTCYKNDAENQKISINGNYPVAGNLHVGKGQRFIFGINPENRIMLGRIICNGNLSQLVIEDGACIQFVSAESPVEDATCVLKFAEVANVTEEISQLSDYDESTMPNVYFCRNEYIAYPDLKLLLVEGKALAASGTFRKQLTDYALNFPHGIIAHRNFQALNLFHRSLDRQENGSEGAFLSTFAVHDHRRTTEKSRGFGCSGNLRGGSLGNSWHGPTLSCVLALGYAWERSNFFGPSVSDFLRGNQANCMGIFSLIHRYDSARLRQSSLSAILAIGLGHNHLHRADENENIFHSKWNDHSLYFSMQNICHLWHCLGMWVGPRVEICCGYVHQTPHSEHCEIDPGNRISMSAIDHQFLAATLGLDFVKTFSTNPCKFNGRIGWQDELFQRHSHGFAHLRDYGFYSPSIGYGHRQELVADANFSLPINSRWSVHCQWNAVLASDRMTNSGKLMLDHIF